jgi:hypothetical protein
MDPSPLIAKSLDRAVPPFDELPLDWADVLARAEEHGDARASLGRFTRFGQRFGRPTGRNVVLAALVTVATVIVATPAFGIGSRLADLFTGGTPVEADRLSPTDLLLLTSGVGRIPLHEVPAARHEQLSRLGGTTIREIAARDGRSYFVIDKADGSHCYAVGSTNGTDFFDEIECPRSPVFPSAARPILNMTVYRRLPSSGEGWKFRLEGIAADGVASVALLGENGDLLDETAVIDNVFLRVVDLPTVKPVAVVALDPNGNRLYTDCIDPASPACPVR